jgi:hypothetical protein
VLVGSWIEFVERALECGDDVLADRVQSSRRDVASFRHEVVRGVGLRLDANDESAWTIASFEFALATGA